MTIDSGQIDLNADVGTFDRENDVVGFNPLESNVSVGVSEVQTLTAEPMNNDKVWDQVVSPVLDDHKGLVEPLSELVLGEFEKNIGCDVMINDAVKEGFDRKSELVDEVNDMEVRSQLVDGGSDVKVDCFSNGLTKDEENKSVSKPSDEDRVVCGDIDKGLAFELNDAVNDMEVRAGFVDGGSDVKADHFSNGLEKDGEKNTMTEHSYIDQVVCGNINKALVFESNDGVKNKLDCEDEREAIENGPLSTNLQLNKEDRVAFYESEKEVKIGKVAPSSIGNGNGLKCLAEEIVNKGAGVLNNLNTIMEVENMIEVADNMAFEHGLGGSCVFGTEESMCQLQDGNPDMEIKAVSVKNCLLHKDSIGSSYLGEEESLNCIKQLTCEIGGKALVMQNRTIDINIVEPMPPRNNPNVGYGFNLVVDIGSVRNLQDTNTNQKLVLSDFNFSVSDLVWGKVRGHPWWPGQIFDPSAASAKAKKHFKKDCYLIAYYGDQTFSWNDASKIKPFLTHFSQLEKEAEKQRESYYFHHAVNLALHEVSRRVEFGLSCLCLPEGVFSEIQTQIITNAGIRKQSSRRYGGDRFLSATSFKPVKLINFVKSLAQSPLCESDRLDFIIARAQLLAFSRSKGYSKLPEFIVHDGLSEDDIGIILEEEEQYDDQIDRKVLKTPLRFSHKLKNISGDSMRPRKKQKKMSELMSEEYQRFKKGKYLPEKKAGNRSISSSWDRKRKAAEDVSDSDSHKSQNKKLKLDSISHNEILSRLCLAAIDPSRKNLFSSDMVSLFVKFRNSVGLDDFTSSKKEMSLKEILAGETGVSSSKAMASMVEPCKDSYWTDRIIESLPEQQSLFRNRNGGEFLLKTPSDMDSSSSKPQAAVENTKLDFEQQHAYGNLKFDPGKNSNESSEEDICPTALILKFTNLDSVPSETKLNHIFERFGPLMESETKLLKKSNRAKVVFKRSKDARAAFSSAGKYSIFGPALSSYSLKKLSSSPNKGSDFARKQSGKSSTSLEGTEV